MDSPVRWEPRIYPGCMQLVRQVRADVRSDLGGFPDDLASDVELCTSELYANAVEYTASGRPEGEVVRGLRLLAPDRIRLEVTDSGLTERRPTMASSVAPDWFENERHRGLFLVSALALAWGHRPVLAHPTLNLGLTVWADFTVEPAAIPSGLPPFVHAG